MKKILATILLILAIRNVAFANAYFENATLPIFQEIGRKDGLQNLSTSNILQDKNGYIWIGTQGGLYKYSGNQMISYRNNPFETDGLIHNLIQTMYYDETTHAIWLGTYQGISRLDIASNTFTNYTVDNNGLSNNVVTAICKDQSGDFWFGTMDGLNRLNHETDKIITYPVNGDVVRSLLFDSQNRILVGTYEGLYYFDAARDRLVKVNMAYPSSYVMVIREFTKGTLTLGMWDGGVLDVDMDFNVKKSYTYADNRVYTLCKTKDGTLWTGTWGGGLFAERDDVIYAFPGEGKNGDINHGVVYALFEDTIGNLWVGTNGGGAYRTNPNEGNYLLFYNKDEDPNSLDTGKMNTIYRDSKGRLWIAIYNKGLNRYEPEQDIMIKYNTKQETYHILPDDQVMDFIEIGEKMYVATGVGVCEYDEVSDSFILTDIMPEEMITYALELDDDGELWVGTYLDGVYHFDEHMKLLHHFNLNNIEYPLSDDLIYDILTDHQGRIWIATNNGLNLYDKDKNQLKSYFKENGNYDALASNNIRRLFEDSKGVMWIGMYGGGIAKYIEESDSFVGYTEADGLLDNSVISIHESKNGIIWVATHGGISLLDSVDNTISNITSSAIIENENYTGDGWTDSDGSIFLGGINGISRFPSEYISKSDNLPQLYITDILEYNTSIDDSIEIFNDKTYAFNYDENYISFEFESLNFNNKGGIHYYYKLSNVDSDWVSSKHRNFASYSNLKPGKYKFMVKAKAFNGMYIDPVSVTFTIANPWYKTIYAYMGYLTLMSLLIYTLIKFRESHLIAERNSELAILNSKLEEAVEELEHVSIKDPLTGIYNRRYLDTVLHDHLELAKRGNNYLSFMMVDIDDFKMINDKYGHVAGDNFLLSFATVLKNQLLRSTDFVARYGGDEFAIVLYDTDPSGTSILADRILSEVRSTQMLEGVAFNGTHTSVSIGVYSAKPTNEMTMKDFITKADDALYEAKSSGKNRVIINE